MTKRKMKAKQEASWSCFDDCHICQSMKKADEQGRSLGEKELLDAFAEQNRKNRLS